MYLLKAPRIKTRLCVAEEFETNLKDRKWRFMILFYVGVGTGVCLILYKIPVGGGGGGVALLAIGLYVKSRLPTKL